MVSRRRRTVGSAASQIPALQGLKMMFDHDDEEEQELNAFDDELSEKQLAPTMNLIEQRRTYQKSQYDSSSSDDQDDEENVRTDIIKFKKRQQKKAEAARRKAEILAQKKAGKIVIGGTRGSDKYNGFIENKHLPTERR